MKFSAAPKRQFFRLNRALISALFALACQPIPAALSQTATGTRAATGAGVSTPQFLSWAPRPVMGWNSWDAFATTVTEPQIKAQADYMAAKLARFGWRYITVDIQWYEPDATGFNYRADATLAMDKWSRLQPAPGKFPSAENGQGFKALAAYVHGKGLKFGIHMMRGISRQAVRQNTPILGTSARAADIADTGSTCPWNPDMFGVDMTKPGAQTYYDSIFAQLAEWGVDFVKVDDLSRPYHESEIEAIRRAIDKTGRPIVFSTSPGETPLAAGPHVENHANMWRISDDFWDGWPALFAQFGRLDAWTPYRGAGHFPDADMLPLGAIRLAPGFSGGPWTRFSPDEQRTMMSLWSIARSPLIMGGDLTQNDARTLALLTNPEVIAVNQTSSGNRQLFNRDGLIGWIADVPNSKDKYLALFNTRGGDDLNAGNALFKSDVITRATPGHGVSIDVDISGAKKLYLVADDGGDGFNADHFDWSEPRLISPQGKRRLTDLQWVSATAGWGQASTVSAANGQPMSIDGKKVAYGIGTHARSVIEYDVPPDTTRFQAFAGLDDGGTGQTGGATARAMVFTKSPLSQSHAVTIPVGLRDLGFTASVQVRDLWTRKDLGAFNGDFAPNIASHGSGLYRISPR